MPCRQPHLSNRKCIFCSLCLKPVKAPRRAHTLRFSIQLLVTAQELSKRRRRKTRFEAGSKRGQTAEKLRGCRIIKVGSISCTSSRTRLSPLFSRAFRQVSAVRQTVAPSPVAKAFSSGKLSATNSPARIRPFFAKLCRHAEKIRSGALTQWSTLLQNIQSQGPANGFSADMICQPT